MGIILEQFLWTSQDWKEWMKIHLSSTITFSSFWGSSFSYMLHLPVFWSEFAVFRESRQGMQRSRAQPPPGTMPSSTAARVALSASVTRSFFSLTSTSLVPPIWKCEIAPLFFQSVGRCDARSPAARASPWERPRRRTAWPASRWASPSRSRWWCSPAAPRSPPPASPPPRGFRRPSAARRRLWWSAPRRPFRSRGPGCLRGPGPGTRLQTPGKQTGQWTWILKWIC